MAEGALPHKTTLSPHIHSADSLGRRQWGQLVALAPLFVTACLTGHAEILRVLSICLVSAIAFEFLAAKLFRKKENLRNGPNTNQSERSGDWGRPNYQESKENKSWGGETVPIPINRSEAEIGAVSSQPSDQFKGQLGQSRLSDQKFNGKPGTTAIDQSKIKVETVLAAALFSLLMPSKCPSEVAILGVFMAIFVAKELFGGTGSYLLHPLLLARVFLQLCFPKVMSEPMLLAGAGNVWTLLAVGIGGIILLKQEQGYRETPVLFMGVCFACEALSGGGEIPPAFFSGVLLTAFFLLADPVTLPLTREGTVLFVLGAAFLSSRPGTGGFSIRSAGYAILWMNLLTPWLDVWLKPVSYKVKHQFKATYPA